MWPIEKLFIKAINQNESYTRTTKLSIFFPYWCYFQPTLYIYIFFWLWFFNRETAFGQVLGTLPDLVTLTWAILQTTTTNQERKSNCKTTATKKMSQSRMFSVLPNPYPKLQGRGSGEVQMDPEKLAKPILVRCISFMGTG